jgi:hypothetical protein
MSRITPRAERHDRSNSTNAIPTPMATASLVDAWWASVLAGDITQPHPVYNGLRVHLRGGNLRLSGELESEDDRMELMRQARDRIGHGIDHLDASGLTVETRKERPGILEQTMMSAFPNHDAAEFALDFVLKHSRAVPKQSDVVDPTQGDELRTLIPHDFIRDARKALEGGHSLLILRVDETETFKLRELLEEDTRSEWTIAAPPQLILPSR